MSYAYSMDYFAFASVFAASGSVSVVASLGDASFVYSFDDLFEFDEWCDWSAGDFDSVELAVA